MASRHEDFAPAESRALRPRIARDLARVTTRIKLALGLDLVAVLLVGGYGRGEGGALGEGDEAAPHNDYDLVAVATHVSQRSRQEIARIALEESERCAVDVDVFLTNIGCLANPPKTLFWLDVGLGGCLVLEGSDIVLAAAKRICPRDIPLDEAGRLLANRATGLALSRFEGPMKDPMRTTRHVAKAILAAGDVRLLAADRYALTIQERKVALERLAAAHIVPADLARAYAFAAAFRARPDKHSRAAEDIAREFDSWCDRIAKWHLAFESYRLGVALDAESYVTRRARLFPHRGDGLALGAPAAIRATINGAAPLFPYVGHPRERLARVSFALAYMPWREAPEAARKLLGLRADATADKAVRSLIALRDVGA